MTTDQNGKGYLTIAGVSSGKYDVEVKFAGDDTYNGCDAKATITFDADSAADNLPTSTTSSAATTASKSSTSGWTYNSEWNCWVDANGIVVRIGDGNCDQLAVGLPLETAILIWQGKLIPKDLADDSDNETIPLNDSSNN